jgi:hypothetical protein
LPYTQRDKRESRNDVKPIATLASVQQEDPSLNENDNIKPEINKYGNKLKNPDVLNNLPACVTNEMSTCVSM